MSDDEEARWEADAMRVGPDGTGGFDVNPRIMRRGKWLLALPVGPARQVTPTDAIPARLLRKRKPS